MKYFRPKDWLTNIVHSTAEFYKIIDRNVAFAIIDKVFADQSGFVFVKLLSSSIKMLIFII